MTTTSTPPSAGTSVPPQRRWALIAIAVIGVALIAMPAVFGMFTKAPKGATMIGQFKPFMTSARLNGYQHELKEINAGVRQADTAVASQLDGVGGQAAFDANYPTFASFDQQWPQIDSTMTDLLNKVQGNLGNYEAVAALPSFRLFPWFFVIPGALVAVAAGSRCWPRSARGGGPPRVALVALGIGLIAAPAAFQMFSRAPKGGRMMTAFTTSRPRQNVAADPGLLRHHGRRPGRDPPRDRAGARPRPASRQRRSSAVPAVAALDAQLGPHPQRHDADDRRDERQRGQLPGHPSRCRPSRSSPGSSSSPA